MCLVTSVGDIFWPLSCSNLPNGQISPHATAAAAPPHARGLATTGAEAHLNRRRRRRKYNHACTRSRCHTHGSASLPHHAPYRHRRRHRYYHARARSCCHCWRSTHLDQRRCHTTHHHRKQHPPHINNNQTEKHKHTRNAAPLQSHISIVTRPGSFRGRRDEQYSPPYNASMCW